MDSSWRKEKEDRQAHRMHEKHASFTIARFRTSLMRAFSLSLAALVLSAANVISEQRQDDAQVPAPSVNKPPVGRLLVITVTQDSDGDAFQRFNRSVEAYELDLLVLEQTKGDVTLADKSDSHVEVDFKQTPKNRLDLLRKALATYKNEEDLVVVALDGDNVILNGDRGQILDRFLGHFKEKTRIVFSAQALCLPDESLEVNYSIPIRGGERFLNAAAFIGYAPSLWQMLNAEPPQASESKKVADNSDQLFYSRVYLNDDLRQKLAIELDHRAELFQSLEQQERDVELVFEPSSVKLKNVAYQSEPVVLSSNGPSKVALNSFGNYLAKAWTLKEGCRYCNGSMISLASTKDADLPSVLIGLFIEEATPFLDDFFLSVHQLNYSRSRINLFVHNSIEYHDNQLEQFLKKHGSQYASVQVVRSYGQASDALPMAEYEARDFALERCKELLCDYYLSLDSVARLELPDALKMLIEANKTIVAPLLSRPRKLWSNFWGAITKDGFYSRSADYVDLLKGVRAGLWNVPHVMNAYLINGQFIQRALKQQQHDEAVSNAIGNEKKLLSYYEPKLKPVLAFTHHLRAANQFQFMLNTHEFGHLVDPTSYNVSRKHPDFYQLVENMDDWERHYLHENYTNLLDDQVTLEKPCPDVSWFPLVSDKFCQHVIEIMETFGQWSGGTSYDPRIEGGYESVPTRDIHLKQVGLHEMWLSFVQEYVMPLQLKEYVGYEHDPPHAELAFVVRYHPQEQASLRPHHDSSTYTLNIALNTPHTDYEGGGCRFLRYNCSVTESRRGWALIHPGRLTHYHEGLPVTSGTRYILVTFVDP